jgi:hypothetical protein
MSEFSRHRNVVAFIGAITVLALLVGVVLHTTGTPGVAVAQEQPQEEANAVPVFAAGFVTAAGKLTRAGGAKLSVKRVRVDSAFAGEGRVEYQVTFAQELSCAPVVLVDHGSVGETKKGFTVSFRDSRERVSTGSDFSFIIVKVSERAP